MRTMKNAQWTKWASPQDFEAAVPSLDTASRGTFKAHLPDGRVLESDFHAIVNNRTNRPVGAVKKGYVIENMPDLASDGPDAIQSVGASLSHAEMWASPPALAFPQIKAGKLRASVTQVVASRPKIGRCSLSYLSPSKKNM